MQQCQHWLCGTPAVCSPTSRQWVSLLLGFLSEEASVEVRRREPVVRRGMACVHVVSMAELSCPSGHWCGDAGLCEGGAHHQFVVVSHPASPWGTRVGQTGPCPASGGSPGPAGSDVGQLPCSPAPLLATWSVFTGQQGQPVHRDWCSVSCFFHPWHAPYVSYHPMLAWQDQDSAGLPRSIKA